MTEFLMMETDIMYKVFTIKEKKWSEEKEWRQVLLLKDGGPDIKYTPDGRPYKEFFLPKEALTGITVLYDNVSGEINEIKSDLEAYLSQNGYHVPVKSQMVG